MSHSSNLQRKGVAALIANDIDYRLEPYELHKKIISNSIKELEGVEKLFSKDILKEKVIYDGNEMSVKKALKTHLLENGKDNFRTLYNSHNSESKEFAGATSNLIEDFFTDLTDKKKEPKAEKPLRDKVEAARENYNIFKRAQSAIAVVATKEIDANNQRIQNPAHEFEFHA